MLNFYYTIIHKNGLSSGGTIVAQDRHEAEDGALEQATRSTLMRHQSPPLVVAVAEAGTNSARIVELDPGQRKLQRELDRVDFESGSLQGGEGRALNCPYDGPTHAVRREFWAAGHRAGVATAKALAAATN